MSLLREKLMEWVQDQHHSSPPRLNIHINVPAQSAFYAGAAAMAEIMGQNSRQIAEALDDIRSVLKRSRDGTRIVDDK